MFEQYDLSVLAVVDWQGKLVYDLSEKHKLSFLNIYGLSDISSTRADAFNDGENEYGGKFHSLSECTYDQCGTDDDECHLEHHEDTFGNRPVNRTISTFRGGNMVKEKFGLVPAYDSAL